MAVVLAIDAGTTGVRTVAVDEHGRPGAYAYREFTAALPAPGAGRARPARDLARGVRHAGRSRGGARRPGGGGDRDHEPARDDGGVGPRHRRAVAPRARVAGPTYGAALRRAARRGSEPLGARAYRARARPVLLGDEARVAAHRRWRRALRQPRVRHRRLVDPVEPHRRNLRGRARHRTVEREPHAAVRHRRARVVAGAARPVRRPRLVPARRAAVEWSLRHDRARRGRGSAGTGQRDRR